jgi:hypothetical protein
MDRVTFAHFETLIADAQSAEALDCLAEELRAYTAANPGDPVAADVRDQLARARQALAGAAARRPEGR